MSITLSYLIVSTKILFSKKVTFCGSGWTWILGGHHSSSYIAWDFWMSLSEVKISPQNNFFMQMQYKCIIFRWWKIIVTRICMWSLIIEYEYDIGISQSYMRKISTLDIYSHIYTWFLLWLHSKPIFWKVLSIWAL